MTPQGSFSLPMESKCMDYYKINKQYKKNEEKIYTQTGKEEGLTKRDVLIYSVLYFE